MGWGNVGSCVAAPECGGGGHDIAGGEADDFSGGVDEDDFGLLAGGEGLGGPAGDGLEWAEGIGVGLGLGDCTADGCCGCADR